jgi:2,3-bisphosphoglycerate-dependent phosphoglycerate mutase
MTLMLVRHAEPVPPGTAGYEENQRPLSAAGRSAAAALADELAGLPVTAICSSPYPRALQTVQPLGQRLGLEIELVDDLRERLLSSRPLPDWRDHVRRSWQDEHYRLDDGESSHQAQHRVLGALAAMSQRHATGTVVAASHGNLIALALRAYAPDRVDDAFWAAMPMPAVYTVAGGTAAGPGLDDRSTLTGRSSPTPAGEP